MGLRLSGVTLVTGTTVPAPLGESVGPRNRTWTSAVVTGSRSTTRVVVWSNACSMWFRTTDLPTWKLVGGVSVLYSGTWTAVVNMVATRTPDGSNRLS